MSDDICTKGGGLRLAYLVAAPDAKPAKQAIYREHVRTCEACRMYIAALTQQAKRAAIVDWDKDVDNV